MKTCIPLTASLYPLSAAFLGFLALPAGALTLSSSSGTWSNVIGAGTTLEFQSIGTENQIRWGDPQFLGSTIDDKSGLGFTGVGASSFVAGEAFAIGTLRHFNKVINIVPGTVATAADLTVNLAFSDPTIAPVFNVSFSINETVNAGPCPVEVPPCPDIIGFSSAIASETFVVEGAEYTLELLGFQSAGGETLTQFSSPESGTDNSATLFARITAPPPAAAVPEPALGFGLALTGLYLVGRRSRGRSSLNRSD